MEEGHEETKGGGVTWNVAVSRTVGDGLLSSCLCHSVIDIGLRDSVPNTMMVNMYHSLNYSKTT